MIATLPLKLRVALPLDVPLRQDASTRLLPWIIALMVYLVAMDGVGLIWLSDTLGHGRSSIDSALTLQLPADTSTPRIDMALGALRQTKGVISARVLPPDEIAKLLQPWLAGNSTAADLPLPLLIDARIDQHAAIDYATLRRQLGSIVPNARLDDSGASAGSVRDVATHIEGVISAGLVIATALIVAIIIFAARIGLAIHRSVIELLHLLGARDAYIAQQFQAHALALGLRGGAIGAAAAAVTTFILGPVAHMLALPLPGAGFGILDWRLWLVLILACLAAGGVAMVTARLTVLRQLARMP